MQNTKLAFITGATRGIGSAILQELGKQGVIVIGTATKEEGAQKIKDTITTQGIKGTGVVLDVNNGEHIESVLKQVTQEFGDINILINNAGITKDMLLLRMSESEWQDVIATNLTSVFRLSRLVLRPMMKAQWGRIINISSVVGLSGNAGQTNYASAKAGMIGFTKSLAKEIGSRHITVNCVAPGFIDTDMTQKLSESQKDALLQHIPLNRLGKSEEIAHAVAFLAGDQASYITGETLNVNGGMYM